MSRSAKIETITVIIPIRENGYKKGKRFGTLRNTLWPFMDKRLFNIFGYPIQTFSVT